MTPQSDCIPSPRSFTRLVTGVLSAVAGAMSLGVLLGAAFAGDQPYWMLMLMEIAALVACVVGLVFARGAFADGPGMALLCVAGGIGVPAVLGYIATPDGLVIAGRAMPIKAMLISRALIVMALLLLAAYEVLRRNPRSRWYAVRAMLAGVPLAALIVLGLKFGERLVGGGVGAATGAFDPSMSPQAGTASLPAWILWVVAFALSLVGLVLACACAHCCIRAFEMGRVQRDGDSGASQR